MEIKNKPTFNQIDNQKIRQTDPSFCLTPLVSVFETSYLDEKIDGDYKMVIQAYIPEESENLRLDVTDLVNLVPIKTSVGEIKNGRWIDVRYKLTTGTPKFYNLWTCEVIMQTSDGDIDCVFYTRIVIDGDDDPKTKRGTVTTVRNSGSGQ